MSERTVRYTIREDERFGSGEFGYVYLARKDGEKAGEKKLYVIKIPIEDKIGKDKKLTFNNEVDILNILTPIQGNKYTSIIYNFKKFPNVKTKVVAFTQQDEKDGIGADWHPSALTHKKAAAKLTAALKEINEGA